MKTKKIPVQYLALFHKKYMGMDKYLNRHPDAARIWLKIEPARVSGNR